MRGNLGKGRKKSGDERLLKRNRYAAKLPTGKEESVTENADFQADAPKKKCPANKIAGRKSGRARGKRAYLKINRLAWKAARRTKGKRCKQGKSAISNKANRREKTVLWRGKDKTGKGEKSVPKTKPSGMESCQAARNVSWKKALKSVQRAAQNARPAGHCAQKRTPISKNSGARPFPEPTLPLAVNATGVTIHKKGTHVHSAEQNGKKECDCSASRHVLQFIHAQLPEIDARPDRGTDEDEGRCI